MPSNPSMSAAIVAAAESDKIGYIEEGTTALNLHIEAIRNVCNEAGVSPAEIDGVFSTNNSNLLAEYLGIHPNYIDTTSVGGCSFQMHVHHAMAAINAGIIDLAVVSHGEAGYSARKNQGNGTLRGGGGDPWLPAAPSLRRQPLWRQLGRALELRALDDAAYAPVGFDEGGLREHRRRDARLGGPEPARKFPVNTNGGGLSVMHSRDTHPAGGAITVQDVLDSRMIV